ncbi:hypothetical protein BC937DRAFT_86187 [Endogone sp. FLAS-F59071]|nr:hypothetical protein BC937DRAFT_86187 [Endogone sp. FLAS-F59071]|eukprot:RUS20199.1 hypothetical protein BC937DRAFT_86187 [Endogone sp. FLAS-F59071]
MSRTVYRSIFFLLTGLVALASADHYTNGQYFGPGIIIVDAPAPNSTYQVNTTLPIAFDRSLDGKLTSGMSIEYVGIFLTRTPDVNITVVNPLNLSSEPTSTVLHPNWVIPPCVSAGSYNLTFFEIDQVNGTRSVYEFSIPISVNVPGNWPVQEPCSNAASTTPTVSSAAARLLSGDFKTVMTNAAMALFGVSCFMLLM